jgi:hypothetical protein
VVSGTRGGWPSERLLRMFVGASLGDPADYRTAASYGLLNDLYAEQEELSVARTGATPTQPRGAGRIISVIPRRIS